MTQTRLLPLIAAALAIVTPEATACQSPVAPAAHPVTPAAQPAVPPLLDDGWRTASPEDVGFDPTRLASLTEEIRGGEHGNVHALLIERDGRLVYEEYFTGEDESLGEELGRVTFGRTSLHDIRSVGKSIVATLIGLAIDEGAIASVDEPLHALLPEYADLLTGGKRGIRLRDLLMMSAGLRYDEWSVPYGDPANDWTRFTTSPDPLAFVLDLALVNEPGRTFTYNTALTQLLAAVLERATGEEIEDYADRVLFRPLGIYDVVWRGELGGIPSAGAGMRMRARDLAKLGSVYLNGGRWKGEQIVPREWIREATRPGLAPGHVEPAPDFAREIGYGYHWWFARYRTSRGEVDVPMMSGNGQQRVMVVPELGLSVTLLAGHYDDPSAETTWMPDRILVERVIEAISPDTLRGGEAGSEGRRRTEMSEYAFPSCDLPVAGPHGTGEIRSVYATMRDGVQIALDIVLPDPLPSGQTTPTILTMTRYWRSEEGQGAGARERFYTSHGYALVVGDVRGTGASFGRWPHHRSEAETRDFVDIIDWIVEQPWSDGRVVGLGSSYSANTADWMSVWGHPALKAVVSRFPDFDPYADLYFPGGVPNAYMGREWGNAVKAMDLNVKRQYEDGPRGVRPVDADPGGELLAQAIEGRRDVPSVWEGLRNVIYRDDRPDVWGAASVDDWGTQNRTEAIERWGGPIQSWASWMDAGTANGVLHRFRSLENPQQVFIGAWSHGGGYDADPFRPIDAEARPPSEIQHLEDLCFVKRRLDGSGPVEPRRRLVYYTMGEGRWKTSDEWPPPGVESQPWYLADDGRLSGDLPTSATSDEYAVDPTATTGTTNRWATNNTGGDVVYAGRAEEDLELLTYTSSPLARPLEITGQPTATLVVASTHEDGAFFVYLEAVAPDGTVVYLTEGLLRGLHRKVSTRTPPYRIQGPYHTFEREDGEPMTPGRITTLAFELMPISVLVPAGHRLRLAIAAADADTFRPIPADGTPVLAVHLGGAHASRVTLPVVLR